MEVRERHEVDEEPHASDVEYVLHVPLRTMPNVYCMCARKAY